MRGILVRDSDGAVVFRGRQRPPKPGTTWVDSPEVEDATRTVDGEELAVEELLSEHMRFCRYDGSRIVAIPQAEIDAAEASEAEAEIEQAFDPSNDSGPQGRWRWLAFQLARRIVRLENAAQRSGITLQPEDDTLTPQLFQRYVQRQGGP